MPLIHKPELLTHMLSAYDWAFVFGEQDYGNTPPVGFTRADVAEVYALDDNEDREFSGAVWGRLKDGRYFTAEGSCDYTGWDCQAGNSAQTWDNLDAFVRGIGDEARSKLGLGLSGLGSTVLE